jgi:glucose-6-phosphate 1-dehydrogenase
MSPEEVAQNTVRGQYGPGKKDDGSPAAGYRQEPDVSPTSTTETFAALKLWIDNWRWEGVPIYLRSGKSLWKRGTEIVVQFKKAPPVIFRETGTAGGLESNKLLFHMQPDQGIELRFHAKSPGPAMNLQKVDMRFDYRESFEESRGTGYEVLVYNAICGDATLFSRTDLVEAAWRVAQPVLDTWAKAPVDFPNYPAGSWGPKESFDLIERDGRNWIEVFNRTALEKVPLFKDIDAVWLHNIAMMLQPRVASAGEVIAQRGSVGNEMYFICRGQVEVLNAAGVRLTTLAEGDFFGELSLLFSEPRNATVRAMTPCDLFVLDKADFLRVLKTEPKFEAAIQAAVQQRYAALHPIVGS